MRVAFLIFILCVSAAPTLSEQINQSGERRYLYEVLYQHPEQDLLKLLVYPIPVVEGGVEVPTRTVADAYKWDILQQQALFGVQYEVVYETVRQVDPDSNSGRRLGVRSRRISVMHLHGRNVETEAVSLDLCDTLTTPGDTLATGERRCGSYLPNVSWLSGDSTEAAILRVWQAQDGDILDRRAQREREDQQRAAEADAMLQEVLGR